MLHVEHLTCGYGPNPLQNHVVKDVSFSAARRGRPAPL